MMKLRGINTKNADKIVNIIDQVRSVFIKTPVPSIPIDNSDDEEQYMSPLETEECAEQEGKGLKILTPQQMLNRVPISLAQLKAGNNSQKLKNEIRQLLYSLYR